MTPDDPPQSPSNTESQADPLRSSNLPAHLEELRAIISSHKKDDPWGEDADRLVNVAATDFLAQVDDRLAMWEAMLVTHAAIQGLPSARRKSLKLTRWSDRPAPDMLSEQFTEGEQLAMVKACQGIGIGWAPLFSLRHWDWAASDKVRNELLSWALKHIPDGKAFWAFLTEALPGLAQRPSYLERLAAITQKNSWFNSKRVVPEDLAAAQAVYTQAKATLIDNLAQDVLFLVTHSVAGNPATLVTPEGDKLLEAIAEELTKFPRQARLWSDLLTRQLMLVDQVISAPGLFSTLAKSIDDRLAGMNRQHTPIIGALRQSEGLNAAFAGLLATCEESPQLRDSGELSAHLSEMSRLLNVERLGTRGEVAAYRASWHELVDEVQSGEPVASVRIIKPGWVRRREDDSFVILIKALVERAIG